MKKRILVMALLVQTQFGISDCSHWNLYGVGMPPRVDGQHASLEELLEARTRTLDYISRIESTLSDCRPAEFQRSDLLRAMEIAAERFNHALRQFQMKQTVADADQRSPNTR